jgi:hypothetical protein
MEDGSNKHQQLQALQALQAISPGFAHGYDNDDDGGDDDNLGAAACLLHTWLFTPQPLP